MKDFQFYLEAAKKNKKEKKQAPHKLDADTKESPFECPKCKGFGELEDESKEMRPCPTCAGRGYFNSEEDRKAAQEKEKLPKVKTFEVKEPKKAGKKK